jgi:transposase
MRNARVKGRRIGRTAHIPVTESLQEKIVRVHRDGKGSLRSIAARFGTSLGTVQRSIALYQRGGPHPAVRA